MPAAVAVTSVLAAFLPQLSEFVLEFCHILLVHVPRTLGCFSVLLLLDFGSLLFRHFIFLLLPLLITRGTHLLLVDKSGLGGLNGLVVFVFYVFAVVTLGDFCE